MFKVHLELEEPQILSFFNSSGVSTTLNSTVGSDVVPTDVTEVISGDDFRVFQRNHGMYSDVNRVTLTDVDSDVEPTTLSNQFSNTDTTLMTLESVDNFGTFENVSVANTNPGYLKIGSEIIKYTGLDGSTLTGITRVALITQLSLHTLVENLSTSMKLMVYHSSESTRLTN